MMDVNDPLPPFEVLRQYLSMNLKKRFHSNSDRMKYFASIRSGFPLTNLADTSTVESVPSSSTR